MPTLRLAAMGLLCLVLDAQPTSNILSRITMIEFGNSRGTAFSIDVDGREYWITARHILTGAKKPPYGRVRDKNLDLKLLVTNGAGEQWSTVKFTVLQPTGEADVVVLAARNTLITSTTTSPPATTQGLLLGGNCEFLGFPYIGGWKAKATGGGEQWFPFIKRCAVSGMDSDAGLWFLDGINNAGFSGGPVITGTSNNLKIVAVVSGYLPEAAEVIRADRDSARRRPTDQPKDQPRDVVNLNYGFILAYDIKHAVDLIKKDPIGPRTHPQPPPL